MRAAYYLRVSTEAQELENQRAEIGPFISRRGWKLECAFEDVVSGGKTEKDRPGFAAMFKAAHQRKFDVLIFWALARPPDSRGNAGDAQLPSAFRVKRSGLRFLPRAVAGLDRPVQRCNDFDARNFGEARACKNIRENYRWA
jgi:hypothetical protein